MHFKLRLLLMQRSTKRTPSERQSFKMAVRSRTYICLNRPERCRPPLKRAITSDMLEIRTEIRGGIGQGLVHRQFG